MMDGPFGDSSATTRLADRGAGGEYTNGRRLCYKESARPPRNQPGDADGRDQKLYALSGEVAFFHGLVTA